MGRDFGQRRENELALEHAGMRDLQFGSVERQIAEEKDVYIEQPRTFGEGFLAAESRFDGAKSAEEIDGLGVGFACDDAIEEPWLVEIIDRFGFVEGRDSSYRKICGGQCGDGDFEVRGAIAEV